MPTGSRSMAVKYSHWIRAAPVSATTASSGRSRREIRSRDGCVSPKKSSSPIAAPVHRSALRRAGAMPAVSAIFETMAASPNSAAPASTWM